MSRFVSKGFLHMLAATVVWAFCAAADAAPVAFSITLTTESVTHLSPPFPGFPCLGCFHPPIVPGDVFYGIFVVDDRLLAHDGHNQGGTLSSFRIQVQNIVWDMNQPGSSFAGFRGPIPGDPYCPPGGNVNCFAPSPGFDVVGGKIVGLEGGVFSGGDARFVDFFGNRFTTSDTSLLAASGTLQVSPVAEPATLALVGLGVAGLGLTARWRRGARVRPVGHDRSE